jgi:hypothetical protein
MIRGAPHEPLRGSSGFLVLCTTCRDRRSACGADAPHKRMPRTGHLFSCARREAVIRMKGQKSCTSPQHYGHGGESVLDGMLH